MVWHAGTDSFKVTYHSEGRRYRVIVGREERLKRPGNRAEIVGINAGPNVSVHHYDGELLVLKIGGYRDRWRRGETISIPGTLLVLKVLEDLGNDVVEAETVAEIPLRGTWQRGESE